MFDISTRTRPQLSIQVTVKDTLTGTTTTSEIPIEVPEEKSATTVGVTASIHSAADQARADAEAEAKADSNSAHKELTMDVSLVMPTHGQWLENQAKMITTVPALSLIGDCELPGVFSDGSPIPAETARRIAGHCSTWTRILTDPATGTPIDAKATTYRIPNSLRLPLIAKWQSCTVPGCTRRSETSEIDHLTPFDHDHPEQGGLTTFMNLHPLCKPHHMRKTEKKFAVRKTSEGSVEYVFSHGLVTDVAPPDHPINAQHAREMERLGLETGSPSSGARGTPNTRKRASEPTASAPPKARKSPKVQKLPESREPPMTSKPPPTQKPQNKRKPRKDKKNLKSTRERSSGSDCKSRERENRQNYRAVKWDSGDPPPF